MKTFCFVILLVSHLLLAGGCSKAGDGDDMYEDSIRLDSTLMLEGRERHFIFTGPRELLTTQSLPLVIMLHGFGGNALQAESDYGFTDKALREKFGIVYPEGVSGDGIFRFRSWNAGSCCDYALEQQINDHGFIDSLVTMLQARFPSLDKKRVYLVGMSNGAMMAYSAAARLQHKFAAIASVSGALMDTAHPESNVPLLHIHSSLDSKVPYTGGIGLGGYNYPSVDATINAWKQFNECDDANTTIQAFDRYTLFRFTGIAKNSTIELYVTSDGGHAWPGSAKVRQRADEPSRAFNATDLIWKFLKQYQLP